VYVCLFANANEDRRGRTVARKFSIGGFAFVQGLDTPKIDKNSTD